ncbi:MAG: ATP-binding protein, partial [Pseudomonadota bacterium]|nr:ATP-binding protein [Pseudomonadota bacterium]
PAELPDGEDDTNQAVILEEQDGPVVALELLLLSLARAQSVLSMSNEEARKSFEALRREWSETYRVQLGN